MQSNARAYCVLSGVLLIASGCHSPYGNQYPYGAQYPYGQGYSQPQYPGGPVYMAPPPQQAPVGTYTPGIGQPAPNGGISWDTNQQPAAQPNPAPTYQVQPSAQPDNNVPIPNDMKDQPSATKPGLEPTTSQLDRRTPSYQSTPNDGSDIPPTRIDNSADEDFQTPVKTMSAIQSASVIQRANHQVPAEAMAPYGRDTSPNPKWLRGVIEYDPQDQSWQITYSPNPSPRDPNGGVLTLANHPDLSNCDNGDVVKVVGTIDPNEVDSRGKPIYALSQIIKLQ